MRPLFGAARALAAARTRFPTTISTARCRFSPGCSASPIWASNRCIGSARWARSLRFCWSIWLALLEMLVPLSRRPLRRPRGPLFALHVTLNTWAYCGVRAVVRAEPDVSGAGSRAAVAASERGVLAISGPRRARPHGAQQRLYRLGGAHGRRGDGFHLAAPADGSVSVGRSQSDRDACDPGGVHRLSAALAQRGVARRARGADLRAEFCGGAVQLHGRESLSHGISRFF